MSDYFHNRSQVVKLGITESDQVNVLSGVPQGSILGPYLYSFSTSTYVPREAATNFVKYADDTSLILPLYKNSTNSHVLDEHNHLLLWSAENELLMNAKKCKVLVIRKPNVHHDIVLPDLQVVSELKILGVIFNDKMTWSSHVHFIIKKCSRLMYAMRILRRFLTQKSMKLFYSSLIRPLIEYCAPLFVGMSATDTKRLCKLQSRFHRIVCPQNCTCSFFPDVGERRLILCQNLLREMMDSNHLLFDDLPPVSKTGRFLLPPRRTQQRCNTFILHACMKYNEYVKR